MCLFPFGCIWNRFVIARNLLQNAPNLVQLMQEFVPQSLARISGNRRSRSTQLDPKLMFSSVSFRLGAFGTIMLLHKLDAKRAKLVQLMQKFMPNIALEFSATNSPDPHHWTLNHVLMHLFPFGCIWNHFVIARNFLQKAPNWYN